MRGTFSRESSEMAKLCSSSGSLFCKDSWVSSISLQQSKTWVLFLLFVCFSILSTSAKEVSYKEHCNSIVPESTSTGEDLDPLGFLQFYSGYYEGGVPILGKKDQVELNEYDSRYASFSTRSLYKTESQGIRKVEGTLEFRGAPFRRSRNRMGSRYVTFELHGFWSEFSGSLCMVGSGSGYSEDGKLIDIPSVLNLKYPRKSTFNTSFVTGSVKSIENEGSDKYFEPISIIAFSQKTYEYTLLSEPNAMCSVSNPWPNAGSLSADKIVCEELRKFYRGFRLQFIGDCSNKNCNIFNESTGFLPSFMHFHDLQCSAGGKLRFSLGFKNKSGFGSSRQLAPETTLVGEGMWVEERDEVCMMGCHLLNFRDSLEKTTVGDCSIGLSFKFSEILSLTNRNLVLGQIWSTKKPEDSGYFERLKFGGRESEWNWADTSRLKYKYTETENATKSCQSRRKATKNNSGRRYPDGSSFADMRFDFHVKNLLGEIYWGSSTPVSIGELLSESVAPATLLSNQSLLNISYEITFPEGYFIDSNSTHDDSPDLLNGRPDNFAAEGVYDTENGTLCLIGCRHVRSSRSKLNTRTETMDCEILIDFQFSPMNPDSIYENHLVGTIISTRQPSDPLYFKPLQVSSNDIYASQSVESIWRMHLETVMVLISLTLGSIFVGLQLLYVRRHPQILPSISLLMLVVLTLGNMIPLVLNLEAFFSKEDRKYDYLPWSGGWVETREVIVRIFIMVAFLLQFRLLQLTWAARLAEDCKKDLWVSEKKALFLCLPLYIAEGLIAWLLHSTRAQWRTRNSLWVDLKSYAGLVLDGFLLPQVLLNLFLNTHERALAPSFYAGTTLVRALPHAYDAYRSGRWQYTPQLNSTYEYANPEWDFYSNAWDFAIPCFGFILAILIFFQQRFGGRFILPRRFREFAEYVKVPVVA